MAPVWRTEIRQKKSHKMVSSSGPGIVDVEYMHQFLNVKIKRDQFKFT